MSRTRWTVGLVFAGVFGFLGFGMWSGFPVWDDAYLVLFLRESTLETLAAHHSHRPLFGLLLKWSAAAFGLDRGPYVAMALALWAILAWQTARLARRVQPHDAFLPSLAALLVLTPVRVTTQFTTATTVRPGAAFLESLETRGLPMFSDPAEGRARFERPAAREPIGLPCPGGRRS